MSQIDGLNIPPGLLMPAMPVSTPFHASNVPVLTAQAAPQQAFRQAPSFGPMQDLAKQMAGYGAPTGERTPVSMGGVPGGGQAPSGGGSGGFEPGTTSPFFGGGGPSVGMPGGFNNDWINEYNRQLNQMNPGYGGSPSWGGLPDFSFGGGNWEQAANYAGKGLMYSGNPLLGLLAGAYGYFTGDKELSDEEKYDIAEGPFEKIDPPSSTGGSPYMPWLGSHQPGVHGRVNRLGNIGGSMDHILREISPFFGQ